MQLRDELTFDAVTVRSIGITAAEDPGVVVVLETVVPSKYAKVLKMGFLFSGSIVVPEVSTLPVKLDLENVELRLPSGIRDDYDTYHPEQIKKIKVERTEDAELLATLNVHLPLNDADAMIDLFRKYNKREFEMTMRSRQGELFEEGTRVDLSEGEQQPEQTSEGAREEAPAGVLTKAKSTRRAAQV